MLTSRKNWMLFSKSSNYLRKGKIFLPKTFLIHCVEITKDAGNVTYYLTSC